MNILYVSDAPANPCTGLYWSVPNQINSQSRYDSVFWMNARDATCDYWLKHFFYHKGNNLDDASTPFNNPDLIVFEGFYQNVLKIYKQLRKLGIPYIIVPRCSLTKEAQKIRGLKKRIANLLFYKRFTKNALAIHYLTENERLTSGNKWNKHSFVIPNGVVEVSDNQWIPKRYSDISSGLKGTFIGRISITHKGLDLLIEAIYKLREKMRAGNNHICIYGPPDTPKELEILNSLIAKYDVADLVKVHPHNVSGKEKEKILLESDYFILTSRLEGHPMGLIEALSYGLPAVVTDGSNMKREIENARCGYTSDNNSDDIKNALSEMLSLSESQFQSQSKNAIKLAEQYRWDKLAEITHQKYLELLSSQKK